MSALLEVQDLHYYYGNIHTLKGLSFEVEEGEMVTLIGANGAGKTTTLQTISGLTPPRGIQGKIIFNGREIQKMRGHRITALGLSQVLEGRHIFPKLTVEENLRVGAYLRKDTKKIHDDIAEMYKLFPRLYERKTSFGGHLSGGEQQMLAIARALMARPRILLLDEPSLGLAPLVIKDIFKTLQEIRSAGTTILIVEQNALATLKIADSAYVLELGKISMSGKADVLIHDERLIEAYLGNKKDQ